MFERILLGLTICFVLGMVWTKEYAFKEKKRNIEKLRGVIASISFDKNDKAYDMACDHIYDGYNSVYKNDGREQRYGTVFLDRAIIFFLLLDCFLHDRVSEVKINTAKKMLERAKKALIITDDMYVVELAEIEKIEREISDLDFPDGHS